jgi:hypothetical protein
MRVLLRRAKDIAEQRRIQAVLMRASIALPPTQIAELTGLSVHSVRVLHSRFLREGEACVIGRPGRGGRRRTVFLLDLLDAWTDEPRLLVLDGPGWHKARSLPAPERLRL